MTLTLHLDQEWQFRRLPASEAEVAWTSVDLPHSPFVSDLDGRNHWLGECEYRRVIELTIPAPGERCVLFVSAAMHTARIFVDQREIGRHEGGYLSFEVDLTSALRGGARHELMLRLDNRETPDVPPGKPFDELDFCWYGGLYRGVELRIYPPLHITDSVGAGEVAGGGVFVRTLAASQDAASLSVKTHVRNTGSVTRDIQLEVELLDGVKVVARAQRAGVTFAAGSSASIELELEVKHPRLWQPDSPALYEARVTLRATDGTVLDLHTVRAGIRRISFSRSGGFTINGQRRRLRGTNRHQEYPRVGYAAPRAAQHRDARWIKEAGFDYVRVGHYPQSPDFLDACDELGIVVMNCIPGWQYMGGEKFRVACYQNARDVIRRDRHHPCVVLWELSLNETAMDDEFMDRLHAIGHEEYPGDQMFTCGWQDRYDVYVHSRQHGKIHHWVNGDKALVVAEYGDWEFYASNEGFDQKTGAGVFAAGSHARQRRQDGERGLRQQVSNHIIALNDTLSSTAVLDGQWSVFDYARGYDPTRAACGVMDVFRLPKFSWYFYRSQRGAGEGGAGWKGGAMVYIASHWLPASDLRVLVLSNCEEVELRLNGKLLSRQWPAKTWMTQHLPHPPFVFDLPAFVPGVLEATGLIEGKFANSHRVATPGSPAKLEIEIDTAEIFPGADESDVLMAHARIADFHGTLCLSDTALVEFTIAGDAVLVGPSTVAAEAGIASVVVRVPRGCESFVLQGNRSGPDGIFTAEGTWLRQHSITPVLSLA